MATRPFPALSRETKDALMPLLVKGTTAAEVAAALDVDPATAAQYLDDAEYGGLAEQVDGRWVKTPATVTYSRGHLAVAGALHWPSPGYPDATPYVSINVTYGEWEGHIELSPAEADTLARLLGCSKQGSPWLIGFLTHAAMSVESYERGLAVGPAPSAPEPAESV